MKKPTVVPMPKAATQAKFLAEQPESLRDFYVAILAGLPSQFKVSRDGFTESRREVLRLGAFCSPFRVKSLVEAPRSRHWSRVVEILNPKGELVDCIVAEGNLTGKPRDAIAALSNRGLQVYDTDSIHAILSLVRNWPVPPEAHLTLIEQVGWVPERDAFILTSGRVITRKGAPSKYRFGDEPTAKEIGTLPQWRDQVAALAVGNLNLLFGISLGFSTALMEFTELDTSIFHFYAKTSRGKTRLLRTALTVWPRAGVREKTWAGTINGLEAEIAKSHGILLGLDELRGDATPDLPALIYRFANGSTKARGRKEGGAQERSTWRTGVISTGEHSFVEIVSKLGGMPTGGQGVRMLDIPATGAYGVFDALHGCETSDDLVVRLDGAIRKAWGAAGAAFVENLLEMGEDALQDALDADIRRHTLALQQHLEVSPGDDRTAEIRRVIQSFALVATAGEWATDWDLTGWVPGTASAAVRTIAARWLAGRGRLPFEQSENLKKVRAYLATNEQRFAALNAKGRVTPPDEERLGYQDEAFFYLLPPALTNLAHALDTQANKLLEAFAEGGFLEKGGESKSLQFRLPASVPGRPRAYRLRRAILDFEEDPQSPSDKPQGHE
ncbi:DUF927 domain-containing protein [Rhodobaculum claviforme]|nr:DUF927 domain-containing protein [Rhodobaculum claviforme]